MSQGQGLGLVDQRVTVRDRYMRESHRGTGRSESQTGARAGRSESQGQGQVHEGVT